MNAPAVPYAPSWVDRLIDRIDSSGVPPWVVYAVLFVAVAVVANAAAWVDGGLDVGAFDSYQTSLAIYVVVGYAGIHYLDHAAARAWSTFRPALSIDDESARALSYQLTTMPATTTLVWTLGAVVACILYFAFPATAVDFTREPVTLTVTIAISLVSFIGTGLLGYHSIHQLRLVGRVHGYVETVDLLHLDPLHAFSGVTAATGILLISIVYVSVLTDPATFANPALFVLLGFTVLLATSCFVVPLWGTHVRIVAEKARRLAAVNKRLNRALEDLDRKADAGDLTDADAFNKHLSSLITQRDVVARTPTWPWQPETLRGFTTALVLPVILWVVFRLLERQVS